MRSDGTLVGLHHGPVSAVGPQPHQRHDAEVRAGTPTEPWGSRRLPRLLSAGGTRRNLFRWLLRRAEGVPVELADGRRGVVEQVVFGPLGFDFWPVELVVAMGEQSAHGPGTRIRRRIPVDRIRQIDVRHPRIVVGTGPQRTIAPAGGRDGGWGLGRQVVGRVVRAPRPVAARRRFQRRRAAASSR